MNLNSLQPIKRWQVKYNIFVDSFRQVWWCKCVFYRIKKECIMTMNAGLCSLYYPGKIRSPFSKTSLLIISCKWGKAGKWSCTCSEPALSRGAASRQVLSAALCDWTLWLTVPFLQSYFYRKRRRSEHKTVSQQCFQPMSMVTILCAISRHMILNLEFGM